MESAGLDLNAVWFVLIYALFGGYAILDGFDLGVGTLHLFTRKDEHRRMMLNSIGPVWDGNEVWLVTGGGALFAAFPDVYATVFSGFYLALMLLLVALIFRGVAIEFRSKRPQRWWRQMWDVSFSAGSVLSSLLLGVALGNLAQGIPLDAEGEYAGGFLTLLRPYPLLVGVMTVSLFAMHGSIYAVMKTEDELQALLRGRVRNCMIFFLLCWAATTMATLIYLPHLSERLRRQPLCFGVVIVLLLALANVPREINRGREFRGFLSSCLAIATLMTLFGLGMYPNLVLSDPMPEHSLTIHNAASSRKTLGIMLTIALIGVPVVIAYTANIYWIFRGKVKLEAGSY